MCNAHGVEDFLPLSTLFYPFQVYICKGRHFPTRGSVHLPWGLDIYPFSTHFSHCDREPIYGKSTHEPTTTSHIARCIYSTRTTVGLSPLLVRRCETR